MVVCAGYLREFPVPVPARCRALRESEPGNELGERPLRPGGGEAHAGHPARLAAAERDDKTQRDIGDRLSQYWLCHQAVLVALAQIGQKQSLVS
jgi:hypothetical protein